MPRDLAPVAIYTYTRVHHLQRTIAALQRNYLAPQTVLYVVSDGAKSPSDKAMVDAVRDYADGVTGFREVVRIYRNRNFGAAESIVDAEERIVNDHGAIISMEDDNVSSRNYLDFLNGGLGAYWDDPHIFSVCGYCPPIPLPAQFQAEYWFHRWNISWGYALWKHKYYAVYPLKNRYPEYKRSGLLRKIRAEGGLCIADSIMLDYKRKRSYPDSILCAKMIDQNLRSVVPAVSKIRNIGSDGTGVSGSRLASKNDVQLDQRPIRQFEFKGEPELNNKVVAEAVKFSNGSAFTRWARRFGVYHELSRLKYRIVTNDPNR